MVESSLFAFLAEGRATARIREIDWLQTDLGSVDCWSDSLKCMLGTMMRSRQPMLLMLGADLVQVYNDAYVDEGLSRHPFQMGRPTAETWPEVFDQLSDQFMAVLRDGQSMLNDNSMLRLMRDGRLVDTYWCYSCSPFVDCNGKVQGVLVLPVETTQRVLHAARQGILRTLSAVLSRSLLLGRLPDVAAAALGMDAHDRTRMRICRTPNTHFEPRMSGRGAANADIRTLAEMSRWMFVKDELWRRLRDGHQVRHGDDVLVPLVVKHDTEVIHFVAFELDRALPFDGPYRAFLQQIGERYSQASDRLAAAAERATNADERDEMLMHAPIATAVLTGARLVFTLANDRYREVVGKRDLIGKTYEEAFPELKDTHLPALLHGLYADGQSYESPESEIWLDRECNGTPEACYFRFSIQPMKTVEGDVYGLIAVAVELTEEVRARRSADAMHSERQAAYESIATRLEQTVLERTLSLQELNGELAGANDALKTAVAFTRHVTDMVPGRIAYCDADMYCRFANDSFCRWLDREQDEVVGRRVADLFPPETMAVLRPYIEGVLAGIPQHFERQQLMPDGLVKHYQIDYVPERQVDPSKRPGVYVMAVDITALKAAEQGLLSLNADLALSRDEAQEANRAKSAFLANMSHEIRTPLNAILGMTHLLARRVADAGQREQLGKVELAARHLLRLVSDVLDLSKIEAGKMVLESNDFVAAEVIDWALDMVRGSAAAKGLTLLNDTESLPVELRGDSLRLSQIIINLLANAVKFTSSGFIVLRADVLETRGRRKHLWFEVQDTGIGLDEATQRRLFGTFEQADASISRRHGGTGLGLPLSRQLARAMGGDAGVESKLGVGSRFWFSAWFEEASGISTSDWSRDIIEADPSSERVAELEAKVRKLHGGRHVLLAEDNPVNLEVAVALLEYVGLSVDTAEDGIEAVAKVKAGGFDLVLMDMQMPQVDGLEATRMIRAEMLSVPIIAMTANAFVDDRHACIAAGMDDHLAKPVQPRILYSMLLRWLTPAESAVSH